MADDDNLDVLELDANLSDIEKPPELPPGKYVGEVQEVQLATSSKGNKYYAIKFVIPPDQISADISEHYEDGAVLYWNRQVVPNNKDRRAQFNLRKLMEALGLPTNVSSIDPNDWMGCRARLNIVRETYQGEARAQIKSLEPAERATPAAAKGKRGK